MNYKVEKYGKKFAVVRDGIAIERGFVDFASAKAVANKLNKPEQPVGVNKQ